MQQRLGQLGTQLFAYAQLRKLRTLATGDLVRNLRISSKQERELFSRLNRAQFIAQVRRGLYLIPERLPLGGKWSPDEILAVNTLMEDQQGRYQICGPSAFNRYGFDEQVPTRVYAYNNRLSGDRNIGAVALTLIKVADERLGGVEEIQTSDGLTALYSSRARSLIDAVYDWSRFNTLPRAYAWIRRELAADRVTASELVSLTLQFGDKGTQRRIGALLEREGVSEVQLRKLRHALPATTGLIPWIPTEPKRGTIDRRWGVVWNEPA